MSLLWSTKAKYTDYNYSISKFDLLLDVEEYIPYKRNYHDLNKNQLLSLINDAKKNHWKALDLSCCGIEELPDELWELTDLRVLCIGNLTLSTRTIKGNNNTIKIIPNGIEKLKNLKALSISELHCTFKKDTPLYLPNLDSLDCYGCNFQKTPTAIMIPSIKMLLFDCKDKTLPTEFASLSNLTTVMLTHSNIIELPYNINLLKNLEELYLMGSRIESLPSSIKELDKLKNLDIRETPLSKSIPPEICSQSAQEIIRYVLNQQSGAQKEYFNESKVIIVGQGNVGKTSLLKRLVENTFDEEWSTEGIKISKWDYKWDNKDVRLNIWDFGGQEIYHSTHQFFLTRRSLYLLVWDALAEREYGRIDYWLRTIQSLADDSPIIIVVNKCDKGIGRIERLDILEYKCKYPQVQDIVYVSCKDNIGISELRQLVKRTVINLPLMRMKWLSTWMNVRRIIEQESEKKDSISYTEYLLICRENGITDEEEALSLIKYLNDLGIVLYYYDDPLLQKLIILSSEWGTDAVYKVLDEQERKLKGRNGILYISDLPHIWKDRRKYPQEYYPHLLNLMEKFQLAFKINEKTYLIAELLNNQTIDTEWNFTKGNTLSFRYEYDFMPAGILTRFIVAANQYLYTENGIKKCWRKGAFLCYETAKALVRLVDDISYHYIQIDVIGKNVQDKRELLYIIRNKLDAINSRYNKITITQKIPCCCSEDCPFLFDYQMLLSAEKKGIEIVQCHYSWQSIPLSHLLDGVINQQTSDEIDMKDWFAHSDDFRL